MGGAEGNATATCLPPPKEHIEEPILYFILAILVGVIVLYFLNVKLLKKVKVFLPYTVLCFLGSFALGLGVQFTEDMHVRWRFRAMLEHSVNQWESAPPHLIVFVFLPPLLFNDAMSLDIHLWSKKLLQCVVLAVPGVIMGTFLTAGSAFALTSDFRSVWSWEICLVLGAILSATDPVAVVSLLKSLGAPREITMIITGESLLNDGVAVVLFLLTFGMFEYNSIELGGLDHCYGEAYDAPKILTFFLRMAVAGPTIGIAFGALCVYVLNKTKHGEVEDHYTAQLMATLFTAYAAFYMAERVFKSSGVLSCVSAALFISWQGWPLFTDPATTKHVWHAFELVANTVIFSYAGLVSAEALSSDFRLSALWIGVALYAFVVLIRGIVIVLLYPLLWYLDRKDPIASLEAFLGFGDGIGDEKDAQSISAKHLYSKTKLLDLSFEAFYPAARTIGWRDLAMMSWGGLRGAVGLALALVVREELDHIVGEFKHEHPSVCDEGEDGFDAEDCEQLERLEDLGDQVLVVYVVVCLLTLVVNAPTSPAIMRYLDLKTRSTAIEELFIRSVVQQLHAESKAEYKKLAKHYILPPNWHGREMEAHEQEMRQQETRANRAGTPPEDSAPSAPGGPPGPRESELGDSNGHNGRDRPRVTRNRIQRFASLRVAGPPADPPAGDGTGGADGADGADAAAAGERAGTPLSALGSKKLSSLVKTLARPLSMNLGRHRRGESATSSGAACEAMYDMSLSYMVTELVERKRQSATLKRERSARRPRDALSDLRNEDIGAESVEDDDAADAAPAPAPGPGPEAPAAPAPARETLADLSAWRDSERSIDGARAPRRDRRRRRPRTRRRRSRRRSSWTAGACARCARRRGAGRCRRGARSSRRRRAARAEARRTAGSRPFPFKMCGPARAWTRAARRARRRPGRRRSPGGGRGRRCCRGRRTSSGSGRCRSSTRCTKPSVGTTCAARASRRAAAWSRGRPWTSSRAGARCTRRRSGAGSRRACRRYGRSSSGAATAKAPARSTSSCAASSSTWSARSTGSSSARACCRAGTSARTCCSTRSSTRSTSPRTVSTTSTTSSTSCRRRAGASGSSPSSRPPSASGTTSARAASARSTRGSTRGRRSARPA